MKVMVCEDADWLLSEEGKTTCTIHRRKYLYVKIEAGKPA